MNGLFSRFSVCSGCANELKKPSGARRLRRNDLETAREPGLLGLLIVDIGTCTLHTCACHDGWTVVCLTRQLADVCKRPAGCLVSLQTESHGCKTRSRGRNVPDRRREPGSNTLLLSCKQTSLHRCISRIIHFAGLGWSACAMYPGSFCCPDNNVSSLRRRRLYHFTLLQCVALLCGTTAQLKCWILVYGSLHECSFALLPQDS